MPLLHFHLLKGRSKEEIQNLLDAAHDAMVQTFEVPVRDRYQIVSEHEPSHFIMEDTGLKIPRTEKQVLLQVFSRPRGEEALVAFYDRLTDTLKTRCAIEPSDVMVSVIENTDAHWSFGHGRAQFLTGDLGKKKP